MFRTAIPTLKNLAATIRLSFDWVDMSTSAANFAGVGRWDKIFGQENFLRVFKLNVFKNVN